MDPVVIDDTSLKTNFDGELHIYPSEYEGHFSSLMISSIDIQSRVRDLAILLHNDFKGKRPVMICTLKGACPFFSDLCRELSKLRQGYDIEFLRASSYDGTSTTGVVTMVGELKLDALKNRHVVVVEDIVDTGTTLATMIPVLEEHGKPASIAVCSLLDKRLAEAKKYMAKYCGFSIPDYFIVGYGLDYNELYRDLNDIFVISTKGIDFDASSLHA